jgi:hypothetical protein
LHDCCEVALWQRLGNGCFSGALQGSCR